MKITPSLENEGANFALFITEKSAKIFASGQTFVVKLIRSKQIKAK